MADWVCAETGWAWEGAPGAAVCLTRWGLHLQGSFRCSFNARAPQHFNPGTWSGVTMFLSGPSSKGDQKLFVFGWQGQQHTCRGEHSRPQIPPSA